MCRISPQTPLEPAQLDGRSPERRDHRAHDGRHQSDRDSPLAPSALLTALPGAALIRFNRCNQTKSFHQPNVSYNADVVHQFLSLLNRPQLILSMSALQLVHLEG